MKEVKKAVIAAAGFGTRFLPATKAMPKEMLPLVDKPIIQYVVEDIVKSGIEDICIVTGWHKRSIEDHFDYPFELEKRLEEWGKHEYIDQVRGIADLANFSYIRQKGPFGNGTPIWNARTFIGNDPFLYLWADDFILASPQSRCEQLIEARKKMNGGSVLGSMLLDSDDAYKRYGYALGKEVGEGILDIEQAIEKPGPNRITSKHAIISGFLFEPEMTLAINEAMHRLENEGGGRELYYMDGVNILLEQKHKVYAKEIAGGKYYDCGNKLEYLKAVVEFGLRHAELAEDFQRFLSELPMVQNSK